MLLRLMLELFYQVKFNQMQKKINKTIRYFFIFAFLFNVIFLSFSDQVVATSGPWEKFNASLKSTGDAAGYNSALYNKPEDKMMSLVSSVIQIALEFLGVVFLILAVYGGYIYMMARGDETDVKKARDILKNSLIGSIIVVSAYAISYFIIFAIQERALNMAN